MNNRENDDNFSNQEKLDMILIYGKCDNNRRAALRAYREKYPDRRMPSAMYFTRLASNLATSGSFYRKRTVFKRKNATDEEHTVAVLGRVVVDPHISIRNIEQESGISRSSIQRILKIAKFKPFKIHLHQGLLPTDYERRLAFLAWLATAREDGIISSILWSDESRFHNNATVNRHNCHYWSQNNPHWLRQTNFQVIWGVNVWCGMIDGFILGPKFYDGTLTGPMYLEFLRDELPHFLENIPLHMRRNIHFQQDGAPPHNAIAVRNHLNETFGDRWIGTHGPIRWPARSPDLTPLDFFLWGYLKDRVYQTPPIDLEDLKNKIRNECRALNAEVLRSVTSRELLHRAERCVEAVGQHFEHML